MARHRHIRTKYDRDRFANLFVQCNHCGAWSNSTYCVNYCPECGCDFDGTETTQRGIYPPGWAVEDDGGWGS